MICIYYKSRICVFFVKKAKIANAGPGHSLIVSLCIALNVLISISQFVKKKSHLIALNVFVFIFVF